MRRILTTIVILVAVSAQLFSKSGTTKSDYPACIKSEWLDDMATFKTEGDIDSMKYYVKSQKCLMLGGGMKVIAVKRESYGVVSFIYNDTKFWTYSEAIKTR